MGIYKPFGKRRSLVLFLTSSPNTPYRLEFTPFFNLPFKEFSPYKCLRLNIELKNQKKEKIMEWA